MWRCLLLTIYFFVFTNADNLECPPGTIRLSNSILCFSFNSELTDFFGAESQCILQNGHLAYIDSAITNVGIGNNAPNSTWDQYWIGAHVVKKVTNDAIVKIWGWIGSNRYVDFEDWYYNEPSPNNDCAVVKISDFTWVSRNCTEKKPFVCSIPIRINFCDDGWTHLTETNSCYKVFYEKIWDEAHLICQSKNSHLASIHSKTENEFLVGLAKSGHPVIRQNTTWIGLHTNGADNDTRLFQWTDGSKMDFTNWGPGQPDIWPDIVQKCGHLVSDAMIEFPSFPAGQWDNYDCKTQLRNFVCKKNANTMAVRF
uniref:C-type lectin domain-containing protein n=1 Tax=Panagrolaimus sp. JU765 TaxID=591449 RepID=A0AC34RNS3_9BILA